MRILSPADINQDTLFGVCDEFDLFIGSARLSNISDVVASKKEGNGENHGPL